MLSSQYRTQVIQVRIRTHNRTGLADSYYSITWWEQTQPTHKRPDAPTRMALRRRRVSDHSPALIDAIHRHHLWRTLGLVSRSLMHIHTHDNIFVRTLVALQHWFVVIQQQPPDSIDVHRRDLRRLAYVCTRGTLQPLSHFQTPLN